ncbi:MAG: 23S rRNA (guanosine(2251)-2'-O)-methyltransferase RlmB [Bacteroidetes bacterium GWA2_30_7]|nr:MAG: 23S rRNA (guanosine(2251)-2'-O)-methyltransferase RlmB [Bacteroidetes bacterium GWA2_30_7]
MFKKKSELIFGIRPLIEAIQNNQEIEKIFVKKGIESDSWKELYRILKGKNVPFQFVPVEKLNSLTNLNHQGVVAFISKIEYAEIEKIIPFLYENGKTPLILILDHITDVRNFGSICRTAECAGVDAIVIPANGSAQINSESIKTSAGAIVKLQICRTFNLERTISFLKDSGLKIISATEKAKQTIYETNYQFPLALVMGAEDTGISSSIIKESDLTVKIPLFGEIASLNVSVSAGIILYEIIRSRMI